MIEYGPPLEITDGVGDEFEGFCVIVPAKIRGEHHVEVQVDCPVAESGPVGARRPSVRIAAVREVVFFDIDQEHGQFVVYMAEQGAILLDDIGDDNDIFI